MPSFALLNQNTTNIRFFLKKKKKEKAKNSQK